MAAKDLPGGTFTMAEDLTVTRMGYGAMQLAGPHVFGPPADHDAAVAVLREAVDLSLNWEMTVTKQINGLMDRAIRENDHTSRTMLEWFVHEQLEEVSSMDTLLRMIRRAGERGLLFVENYLAQGRRPVIGEPEPAHE